LLYFTPRSYWIGTQSVQSQATLFPALRLNRSGGTDEQAQQTGLHHCTLFDYRDWCGRDFVSTLAASGQFADQGKWKFLTPVLAAVLTITSTLLQTFQWEAAWREMVLTAEQLEKERDRILVMEPAKLDATSELAQLNNLVIEESQGFFDRVLGRSGPPQGRFQK
jgi:hypothetical protein